MEVDIFFPYLNIALEYQGIGHYKAMKHLGGKKALAKLKKRDREKRQKCLELGITLIEIPYWQELSLDNIVYIIKQQVPTLAFDNDLKLLLQNTIWSGSSSPA
jgi:hypothetical protein